MEESMVLDAVQRILVDLKGADPAQITPETSLADQLNVDSIDVMDLMMELETAFSDQNLVLDTENLGCIKTVGDMVSLVEKSL